LESKKILWRKWWSNKERKKVYTSENVFVVGRKKGEKTEHTFIHTIFSMMMGKREKSLKWNAKKNGSE